MRWDDIYHHHHVVPQARISLTLSRHFSLSFIDSGRSSGPHLVSSHSCWMYVRNGHPTFAWPYVGVHRSTSLMSSSLLLQQYPACLVRLTLIIFVMGGRWPYSVCLVECCRQDDGGLEKKAPREHKINPVWFPSHSHSMMLKAGCFPVSRKPENKPGCLYGGGGLS